MYVFAFPFLASLFSRWSDFVDYLAALFIADLIGWGQYLWKKRGYHQNETRGTP